MILTLLALAAAAAVSGPPAPSANEAQLKSCATEVRSAPERAIETAAAWQKGGGGLEAATCLGLAYAQLERWPSAAATFEQAALAAQAERDARAADFWVQAGNAWLAGDDPAKARRAFDAALATNSLIPEMRGEVHLDRARAAVMQDDLVSARGDIDKGLELVSADPFAWYLSAALARKQNDLGRARNDIAKAVSLAPLDGPILLEAGNIAGLSGETEAAKGLYARAARVAPNSDAARRAAATLAANGGEGSAEAPR